MSRVEELKDLSGSTTFDCLGNLEIFRYAQDDNLCDIVDYQRIANY